ncbi:uncharacterized protein LOC118205647 [Stegodyphus dumicola]|uniref:uncharacterized protein LOC118205647 n=1 Tax=Stegodyphus dumicola TaxID=202533 RepID=UPI0015AB97C5|nr:uncharacterized protein LOC118205647 [Stegodyphus dumicola]
MEWKKGLYKLDNSRERNSIFNVNNVCSFQVSIERYKPKVNRPTQCYKCQQFGHIQYRCFNHERCCKCGESHRSSTCKLKEGQQLKCVLCGQNHVSSFSGCPEFQKRLVDMKRKQALRNPAPSKTEVNIPTLITDIPSVSFTIRYSSCSEALKKNSTQDKNIDPILDVFKNPNNLQFIQNIFLIVQIMRTVKSQVEKLILGMQAAQIMLAFSEFED